MRLYDALWTLAAADLKASLENRAFGKVSAATPQLEKPAARRNGKLQLVKIVRRSRTT
jgi:hypothetical protein